MADQQLAVVTGASTGIGRELARCCAVDGYALIICANEAMNELAEELQREGAPAVEVVVADLAQPRGWETVVQAIGDRPVAALLANAGRGLGGAFLDQDFSRIEEVIDLNVTGTLALIQAVAGKMQHRNSGRILITGSIAGVIPGSYQAVYNGTKAFLDSFSYALRNELQETGVTVTCLMPGPTDTAFFDRADMNDTPVGQDDGKADPAKVARDGYDAMLKGEAGIVSGFMNKVESLFAGIIPDTVLAEMHRRMAEPARSG